MSTDDDQQAAASAPTTAAPACLGSFRQRDPHTFSGTDDKDVEDWLDEYDRSAQACQPQFDPPLPPFRTSRLESWFEEFAAALYHNGIWIQELMYEVLEYHLPQDLKHHLTYFSWSPRPTPLAPQPVQTIPLPATGHIDSTPATAPCTVAFTAETWSAELSVPGDSTTSAGRADLPADCPPVPAPVEARDTTHTMDPAPAVPLHAISFPCTPVPAAQNLVDCQHLLTSSSMYPTEVKAPEHAWLNVHDAVTMSGNPEGRTPGSPQVEHTVNAPTDAKKYPSAYHYVRVLEHFDAVDGP
ncbi:hypothetical protein HPB51_028337 [Rhipicephalus microplus]|uniref:Uncharacterized protein n=1 Tax=Rhipicephalus microplus TaxID=6941 RepID=A0A9J6CXS7_RHIMP|nr:hypothetical protein HPB51_028337 [Rhipicephalus microplus]